MTNCLCVFFLVLCIKGIFLPPPISKTNCRHRTHYTAISTDYFNHFAVRHPSWTHADKKKLIQKIQFAIAKRRLMTMMHTNYFLLFSMCNAASALCFSVFNSRKYSVVNRDNKKTRTKKNVNAMPFIWWFRIADPVFNRRCRWRIFNVCHFFSELYWWCYNMLSFVAIDFVPVNCIDKSDWKTFIAYQFLLLIYMQMGLFCLPNQWNTYFQFSLTNQ